MNNNNILFLFIIWGVLFCLGVIYLFKCKLWKTDNHWILFILFFSFILIFVQISVLHLCYKQNNIYEGNQTFTLFDRNIGVPWQAPNASDAPEQYNWENPLNFGAFRESKEYNNNGNNLCNKNVIIQLTELQSVSAQQLQDATRSYNDLKKIYDVLNQDNLI